MTPASTDKPAAPMTVERLKEIAERATRVHSRHVGYQDTAYLVAREDIPALIAEVERLRGEVERLKAQEKAYINPPGEEWPR